MLPVQQVDLLHERKQVRVPKYIQSQGEVNSRSCPGPQVFDFFLHGNAAPNADDTNLSALWCRCSGELTSNC